MTYDGQYTFFVRSQEPLKKNSYEYDETAIITAGDGVGVGKVFHYENRNDSYLVNSEAKARKMVQDVLLKPNEFIKVDMTLIKKSSLPAQVKTMMIQMSNGIGVSEEIKAKSFYMLYPGIGLDLKKDGNGKYLKNLQERIVENCGQISASELKIALVYIVAVSSGFSRINADEYSEIKRELTVHDRSNSKNS